MPPVAKPRTIEDCLTAGDALDAMTAQLAARGFAHPREDALRLIVEGSDRSREDLILDQRAPLTQPMKTKLEAMLKRRLTHEPVTRILGQREFFGRTFRVTPDTLDPRPDTETLVSVVLAHVTAHGRQAQPLRILDVGTGTGALLVSLLAELPSAQGIGTDISAAALDVARDNANRLGVADRACFDVRDGVEGLEGPFDVIVSNPPYIARDDIATLMPEVRAFDPHVALDGGADGLEFYRLWVPHFLRLAPCGLVAVEVGFDQSEAVQGLFHAACQGQDGVEITTAKDLSGHVRCVAALTLPEH